MRKLKTIRRLCSFSLITLLLLSFVTPALAIQPNVKMVDLRSTSPELTASKISAKLSEEFEKEKYVTYLIKMKEQTDTELASQQAYKKSLAKKETPAVGKLSVRNAVVSSLRETASRTQHGLVQYLDKMKATGAVQEYESFFIVNAMAITSTKEVMEKVATLNEVEKILPNEERFLDEVEKSKENEKVEQKTKNNKEIEQQEEIKQDSELQNIEWNIESVGAPQVWDMGIDGSGVVVANLDTGVELEHPALQRKWRGYNENGEVVNPELSWYDAHSGTAQLPADTNGHGTHTMGTMVGSEENGTNMIGVAPGSKWIAVRVFDPSTTDQILLRGGQWILAPVDSEGNLHPELAPDVVNNSWGGGPGLDEWYRPMVQSWRDAQIFPEFSAGNSRDGNPGTPGSVANPANYPESVATGATDSNNLLAGFSLRGPSPYGELKPEVSAPGVDVRSSVPGGGYEGGWSGTSMAGPHTTAIAALLLSVNSSLTVDQLEEIITSTAIPLTDSQYPESPNNGYGYGLVNAYDAVGAISNGLGNIAGRVTKQGDDFEAPELEHTPVTTAYTGLDIPLTARVTDNVGVVTVEAFARVKGSSHWTYIAMQKTSGDHKDGIYQGSIPYFLVSTEGVEYYFRVNDYGNNSFETQKYPIEISNGVTPGYVQDFENDNSGFVTGGTNNTWEWGTPTSGPNAAYSGSKLIATNLSGNYADGSDSYMLMPPIDLTEIEGGAFLTFKEWYDLENNFDFGGVYIASESSDFEFEEVISHTGSSDGWQNANIDLSAYAGQQVFVLFNLVTDGSLQAPGWYIDDIAVHGPDNEAPAAPTNLTGEADDLGVVTLNWSEVTDRDLKEYVVYRSTEAGTGYEMLGTSATTDFEDMVNDSGTYYYVVTTRDFSENESEYSPEIDVTVTMGESIFSDNFDAEDDNGWTHGGTNDVWERGTPTAGITSAVSDPNVWGTALDDQYKNSSDFWLMSPEIDLAEMENATLSYWQWYELEAGYDNGLVEITNDGGDTWTELALFSSSTDGKQWVPVAIGLDDYIGDTVQLRYRVTTDGSVQQYGWYIDNFKILDMPAPDTAYVPAETKAEPTKKEKVIYDFPEFKLTRTEKSEVTSKQPEGDAVIQALPVNATVSVIESGRSVKTDASTGRYQMMHVAGDFTLRAEAYGYYPQDQSITIHDEETTTANFNLEAIPYGTVTGTITDERSGEPIAGASILVMEDPRISPTTSDENGNFTLEVLEGEYTLAVSANDYYNKDVSIEVPGNETVTSDVSLKPFIGFPGEIAYDDGTAENARAFFDAGNGWAVKMSPEEGTAKVTGALFRFWDTEWPSPGGTAFKYAVYDASGPDGAPGRMLAGPFDGTALRNGEWTEVSFGNAGVMIEGDFYVAYIQETAFPNSPGLATDEDGTKALRSWQLVGGAWSQASEAEGNYMIRALVQYAVGAPTITSPTNNSYTNQESVPVTGTSNAEGATVKLYNGESIVATGVVENGQFSIDTPLQAGLNSLSVEAVVDGRATDRSETVNVTLDQVLPSLEVSSPNDGENLNQEVLYVTGTTSDEHFASLWVNDQEVNVLENGTFRHRLLVDEGENVISVKAVDLAGNETVVTRTVIVDLEAPEISNISPAEDLHINAGETAHVSFDSEEGLGAAFRIELPLGLSSEDNEITMTETSSGHYEGSWTTPDHLQVEGAVIVVRVWDDSGNSVEAEAPGKLYVTKVEEPINQAPIAVIEALDSTKQKKPTTFDGSQSRDADGQIISYQWDFGDGNTASEATVSHRFMSPGTYTVTLTVTDNEGLTDTNTHTIIIN